jgi:acetyl-CoA synthetase
VAVDDLRDLGDPAASSNTYWSRFTDHGDYFASNGAKKDADGGLWLLGRGDDVMKVSRGRISTRRVESALVSHPAVAEAAVVDATDPTTARGRGFRHPAWRCGRRRSHGEAAARPRGHWICAIAKPRQIMIVAELPRTRSGKVRRCLLCDVAAHRELGDVGTFADSTVMSLIGERLPTAASED